MKTLTFTIDLKSFFLGVLTLGGILLLTNARPAQSPATDPNPETQRFKVVSGANEAIILDTHTGRFVISPRSIGQPRWFKGDFESIQEGSKR
jgi:hypothetical protein